MDTQFLGGDILDEEHQLRPGQGGVDPAVFNLADAVILGNIGDESSSFETSDSGFHIKNDVGAARLYVSGRSQAVMSPDAVIARIDSKEKVRLTPFEKHVLRFIDGKRPVEVIRKQAGLDEAEVKTALANLADKGVVKVTGRALADGADFDGETAPGNVPKGKPRRMRGTLVGAVVVVGDAADQAIDDAFRTNVRIEAPNEAELVRAAGFDDDDGVFTGADHDLVQVESADIASFGGGTDEVPARTKPPTSSAATVRPGTQRNAINARGTGLQPVASVPVLSDVDLSEQQSDGFDDFGEVSNVATAMVQQPSLSSEGSLPGVEAMRGPNNAFADPPRGLSDLEDFDDFGVDELADSRVAPRPNLPSLPSLPSQNPVGLAPVGAAPRVSTARVQAAPPALLSEPSRPRLEDPRMAEAPDSAPRTGSIEAGGSIASEERGAWVGDVWGDDATNARSLRQASLASSPSSVPAPAPASISGLSAVDGLSGVMSSISEEATNVLDAPAGLKELRVDSPSTSLSELLDRDESGDDSDDDDNNHGFDEESTGVRAPPLPAARPIVQAPRTAAASSAPSAAADADAWSDDGTAQIEMPAKPAPAPPRPAPRPATGPMPARGSAGSDLYPDDDSGSFVAQSTAEAKKLGRDESTRAPSLIAERRPLDETVPPSDFDDPDDDDDSSIDSAWSSSNRPQPAPPEPSQLRAPRPRSQQPPPAPMAADAKNRYVPTGMSEVDSLDASSAEVVDSAMVIRPALKVQPKARKPKLAASASAPAKPNPAPSIANDDDDFMVDPDATLNLPALPKSQEGAARRKKVNAAAPPDPEATGVAEPPAKPSPNRAPTEDMRRKARNLFEQAQNDHREGRVGAARMNVKLATIYDPENEAYRRLLADWERPSGTGADARPEYVDLYEKAQEREDEDDVDGALDLLEKGVRIAPNPAAFHNRIGVLLAMRKKDFDRARDEIQKAIALDPQNAHYRNNLGKVMEKVNRRRNDAVA